METPKPTDEAEAGGRLLHADGQREQEGCHPEQRQALRRTDLRVGSDPRRIVVGCARHDAGTHALEVAVAAERRPPRVVRQLRLPDHHRSMFAANGGPRVVR
jgi:hypothetical protein